MNSNSELIKKLIEALLALPDDGSSPEMPEKPMVEGMEPEMEEMSEMEGKPKLSAMMLEVKKKKKPGEEEIC